MRPIATLAAPTPTRDERPIATVFPSPDAPRLTPIPSPTPPLPRTDARSLQLAQLHSDQPSPDLELLPHYVITATLDPPILSGEMVLTLPHQGAESLDDVLLRLYGNSDTIYSGSQMWVGETQVDGVVIPAVEDAGGTALRVPLPAPLLPGESVTLTLTFRTTIASGRAGGYGIQQVSGDRAIFGSPFPLLPLRDDEGWQIDAVPSVGDAVSSPAATWDIWLRVPEALTVVSTGSTVEQTGAYSHIVTGPARDVALVTLPQNVDPIERDINGTRLRYWPDEPPGTFSPEDAVAIAAAALAAHIAEFGPPPYAEIDVVEADVPIGGYEYPGLVLFDVAERVEGNAAAINFLLPHELAHQWFYALLGNDVTEEPWIDEGLATYAQLRYLARVYGDGSAAARRAAWEQEYAAVLARDPVGVNRSLYGYSNWVDYRGPTYYASAILFDDLRQRLGDDQFREGIDRLMARYAFGELTTSELTALFDELASEQGVDLTSFWQRWLVGEE